MGDISVLIDTERYDSALTGLRALVAEVRQYPGLPIAVVDEGITDDQALRAVPGVVGVEPLSPDRRSILTGLDRASLMAAGRSTPWTVGGVDAGGDYPSLLDGPQGSIAPPAVCAVVNLSLGERDDALVPTSPDDSVVHALEHLSRTVVCVVAAGNGHNARYDFETLSPWAESPAVLSVGATVDEDGTELAPYSARGSALRPELGPDVLAWGRSAVAPHPPGTSFAAARVSAMVAFARAWLWNVRANVDLALGRPTGVPLVGVFVIDIGFMSDDRQYSPPAPWAALPLIGALAGELDPLVTIADELITTIARVARWSVCPRPRRRVDRQPVRRHDGAPRTAVCAGYRRATRAAVRRVDADLGVRDPNLGRPHASRRHPPSPGP
jgi:hypothetical protein